MKRTHAYSDTYVVDQISQPHIWQNLIEYLSPLELYRMRCVHPRINEISKDSGIMRHYCNKYIHFICAIQIGTYSQIMKEACYYGLLDEFEFLLKNKVDNFPNADECFKNACKGGNLDCVKLVWKNACEEFYLLSNDKTLNDFHFNRCAGGIKYLGFGNYPNSEHYLDILNNTQHLFCNHIDGFIDACEYGHLEIITYLLETIKLYYSIDDLRFDVGLFYSGFTKAGINGHTKILYFLYSHVRWEFFHYINNAIKSNNVVLIDFLIKSERNQTYPHYAINEISHWEIWLLDAYEYKCFDICGYLISDEQFGEYLSNYAITKNLKF